MFSDFVDRFRRVLVKNSAWIIIIIKLYDVEYGIYVEGISLYGSKIFMCFVVEQVVNM